MLRAALRIKLIASFFSGNTGPTPGASKTFQPQRCGRISMTVTVRDSFEFKKRGQLFVGTDDKSLSVAAMRVCNPNRSPVGINRCDTAQLQPALPRLSAMISNTSSHEMSEIYRECVIKHRQARPRNLQPKTRRALSASAKKRRANALPGRELSQAQHRNRLKTNG